MLIDISLILIGITMLYFGGDLLITGSIRIAHHFQISPFVIGATIIGFGTSAPELAVSIFASFKDSSEVALGNAIGSNIANICLVLGLTSLFGPLTITENTFKKESPALLVATFLIVLLAWDLNVTRIEGLILLSLMGGYLWLAFTKKSEFEVAEPEEDTQYLANAGVPVQMGLVVVSLVILILGAHWLVTGAVNIARLFGISEWLIGITIVAVGTSLPEIVSSLMASFKGHHEMSVGNIYGSNIFNIQLVIGTASTLRPLEITEPIRPDLGISTFFTCLLLVMMGRKMELSTRNGIVLLMGYTGYITGKSIGVF